MKTRQNRRQRKTKKQKGGSFLGFSFKSDIMKTVTSEESDEITLQNVIEYFKTNEYKPCETQYNNSETLLFMAVKKDKLETAKYLVSKSINCIGQVNTKGRNVYDLMLEDNRRCEILHDAVKDMRVLKSGKTSGQHNYWKIVNVIMQYTKYDNIWRTVNNYRSEIAGALVLTPEEYGKYYYFKNGYYYEAKDKSGLNAYIADGLVLPNTDDIRSRGTNTTPLLLLGLGH